MHLKGTRGELIRLLHRGPATAGDLAENLGLTGSAIRLQLTRLVAEGLVEPQGTRPTARRPEVYFVLTASGEALFPKAYPMLFNAVLSEIRGRENGRGLEDVLESAARRIADALPQRAADAEPYAHAAELVEQLGGAARIERTNGVSVLKGANCPFGEVTGPHPEVCKGVERLLSAATGLKVHETCDHSGARPRCIFHLHRPDPGQPSHPG